MSSPPKNAPKNPDDPTDAEDPAGLTDAEPAAPGGEASHEGRRVPTGDEASQGEAVHGPPYGPAPEIDDDQAEVVSPAPQRLEGLLESLLFAADRPMTLDRLRDILSTYHPTAIRQSLESLAEEYRKNQRGIELHEVAGGYQLRTSPRNAEWVQRLLQAKPVRLTRAQLETLAIISYRQPITRPEIDDIRGVDSGGTLKTLLERHLVRILGKKEEPGRPMLYGTTRDFLEFFNLRDLKDLPTLREYYELSDEHQTQVNAMSAALEDLQDKGTVAKEPPPPPPLGRVELKDLNLGDDEEELSRIDQMIQSVKTDFHLDPALVGNAGSGSAGGAATTAGKPKDHPSEQEEREPEEL